MCFAVDLPPAEVRASRRRAMPVRSAVRRSRSTTGRARCSPTIDARGIERAVLVGHSLGGLTIAEVAAPRAGARRAPRVRRRRRCRPKAGCVLDTPAPTRSRDLSRARSTPGPPGSRRRGAALPGRARAPHVLQRPRRRADAVRARPRRHRGDRRHRRAVSACGHPARPAEDVREAARDQSLPPDLPGRADRATCEASPGGRGRRRRDRRGPRRDDQPPRPRSPRVLDRHRRRARPDRPSAPRDDPAHADRDHRRPRGAAGRSCAASSRRNARRPCRAALLDAPTEARPPFWDALAEPGWLGLHVAEEYGGAGYGLVEQCVVLEELGRAARARPVPADGARRRGAAQQTAATGGRQGAAARPRRRCTRSARSPSTATLAGDADGDDAGGCAARCSRCSAATSPTCSCCPVADDERRGRVGRARRDRRRGHRHRAEERRPDPPRRRASTSTACSSPLDRRAGALTLDDVHATRRGAVRGRSRRRRAVVRRDRGGVREGARAVRPADRAVPGREAPLRRHARAHRARARGDVGRGPCREPTPATVATSRSRPRLRSRSTRVLRTAKDCVQTLGGIGFTWEHDAHLYLRRALTLHQLVGTPPEWRAARRAGRADAARTGGSRSTSATKPSHSARGVRGVPRRRSPTSTRPSSA